MKGIHRRAPKRGPIVARRGIALGLVVTLLTAGIAIADDLALDDPLVAGVSSVLAFGNICPAGLPMTKSVNLWVERKGSATGGGNVFANGSEVSVTRTTNVLPAYMTSSPVAVGSFLIPTGWSSSVEGTKAPLGTSSDPFLSSAFTILSTTPQGSFSVTIGYNAKPSSGGTPNKNQAVTVTGTVLASTDPLCSPADLTPPVITPSVVGSLGTNGWYTGDVTVSWTVTDAESPVSSSGCGTTPVMGDTMGTTFTCSATSAGGTASQSVVVKRDATAPIISGSASPAAVNGWNTGDVTVSFSCSDATSGVASCGPDQTLSADGAGQSVTGTAVDNAGNSDSATVTVNIDSTPPVVALIGGPVAGGVYYFGMVPTEPTCEASDDTSGLDPLQDDCLVAGYSQAIGEHTVTAVATDVAGNESTDSKTYVVKAWSIDGFYRPVDMTPGLWNMVKGGSTVPLKFRVFAGTTELTSTAQVASLKSVSAIKMPSCQIQNDVVAVDELTPTSDTTTLRYDQDGGQFIYNWKTPKLTSTTCFKVVLTTLDGSTKSAYFQVNK